VPGFARCVIEDSASENLKITHMAVGVTIRHVSNAYKAEILSEAAYLQQILLTS
jgi:hypothetical protein